MFRSPPIEAGEQLYPTPAAATGQTTWLKRKASKRQKGELKTARIPIKIVPVDNPLKKPDWIRVKAGNSAGRFGEIKTMLRESKLHTVCEEATCPNIGECFGRGTATFMILGDICTRRCPFCDVGHGQPLPPNPDEPRELGESVAALKLKYVVITSVDRDDLRDGGAQHFVDVIATPASCHQPPPSKPWCPTSVGAWKSPWKSSAAPCPTC
jgi:lipoate synthase